MKLPPLLRKPAKLLLCTVLLAILAGAALLFYLQAWIDGLAMENSMDAYAYVGTLTYDAKDAQAGAAPDLAQIDAQAVSLLQNSRYLTAMDTRTTRAGQLAELKTVPDTMINTERLTQHYFVLATVTHSFGSWELSSGLLSDSYVIQPDADWRGERFSGSGISLSLYRTAEEEPLPVGSRVFLIGRCVRDSNGIKSDAMLSCTAGAAEALGGSYADSLLMTHAVAVLPEDADAAEWVTSYLAETGLTSAYETWSALQKAVTVREISDFSMHPYVYSGRIFLDAGRGLAPADSGTRVCMISQGLANRNRLNVGDTIRLSVADGCYTTASGWESGHPTETEEMLHYGDYAEYTIVGVFTQRGRDLSDPLFFDQNDILIPADGTAQGAVRSYNLSFRVEGSGYDAFRADVGETLSAQGYRLKLRDAGWDDVEDTFEMLIQRRKIMLASAAAVFALTAVLFAVLTNRNCRYAYGLKRVLGAHRREAARGYCAAFFSSGLIGLLLAVGANLLVYVRWMRQAMASVLTVALPEAAQCLRMLAKIGLLELALSALVLLALCVHEERHGLLRLIRRET